MSNLLAGIYSKADSLKRALNNALTEPLAYAQQTIGYGVDRLNQMSADLETADSKSVLVSKEQKAAAKDRATNTMADAVAGAGIIVPAQALNRSLANIAEQLIGQGKAREAYATTKMFLDPADGVLKAVIPDNNRVFKNLMPNSVAGAKPSTVPDMMDTSDLPSDLQKLLAQTTVVRQKDPGAYYSALQDKIGLGPTNSDLQGKSEILHEVQHASQYMYDMPRGGNPDFFFEDFAKFQNARAVLDNASEGMMKNLTDADFKNGLKSKGPNELRYEDRRQLLSDPASISSLQNFLLTPRKKAYELYAGLPGEVESRLVQKQFETGDYTTIPNMLRDTPAIEMTRDPKNVPKVDSDPIPQAILNKILGYGE